MEPFTLLVFTCLFLGFHTLMGQTTDASIAATLIGTWKLDMTPTDPDDDYFEYMEIKKIKDGAVTGWFYRSEVKMKNGRIDTTTGTAYIALVSGDKSGAYNTTAKLVNGRLEGTTHSLKRNFISVWTGVKE